ncbi:Bardet-Biedl syndrome 10 protein isoform X2 [Brienomyrus brachyistius]|uniref:Bardet-Biedl syndrome 10 protein isoform X2 n=1 Tax=Brienomyrus brachyistius TaxID=42636 RepID=UPI0020B37609|nr:Bardet-Biedl syndrome 10 protein isoform X2 [Brienomyrus brachyistius]
MLWALVGCVSAHCIATGDGAKSFILLLAALIRGIRATRVSPVAGWCPSGQTDSCGRLEARRAARQLLSFQTQVLDAVVKEHVVPHATSLFSHTSPAEARRALRLLLEAFFRGRAGQVHCGPLAEMACDFYHRWNCERDRLGTLRMIRDHFPELHTSVTGFPTSKSRILQGLVLHRDLTVYCPTEGPMKAVVLNEALQPLLTEADSTLIISSSHQFQGWGSWVAGRVEQNVASLQHLQVRLLLSAVKQSDLVLYHAKKAGMSVVECLDMEELSLFCHLSGVLPLTDLGDLKAHIASVTFCQPVVLGSRRYTHVGIPEGRDFLPHCLVLCGPTESLTNQCVSAFGDAIRVIQRVCEPVRCQSWHMGKRDNITSASSLEKSPSSQNEIEMGAMKITAGISQDIPGVLKDSCMCLEWPTHATNRENILVENCYTPDLNTSIQGHDSAETTVEGGQKISDMTASVKENLFYSNTLIEPGAVLPAGGAFEFLLHHYLLKYTSLTHCPDTQAACRLVAEALLSVPRQVYAQSGTAGHFLKVYTSFVSGIQSRESVKPVSLGPKGLESVACKYDLLVSVLQCLGRLLSVDAIIHTTTLRVADKAREEDVDEDVLSVRSYS